MIGATCAAAFATSRSGRGRAAVSSRGVSGRPRRSMRVITRPSLGAGARSWPRANAPRPLDRGKAPSPPTDHRVMYSEPTRLGMISYAVFCLKKKKNQKKNNPNLHKQKKKKQHN